MRGEEKRVSGRMIRTKRARRKLLEIERRALAYLNLGNGCPTMLNAISRVSRRLV
jgi:hypothetical protein